MKCVKCNSEKTVKNGHQGTVQRYKCKKCGAVYSETSKKGKYTRANENVVRLLYGLLENEFYYERDINKAIKKAIDSTEKYSKFNPRIYDNYAKKQNKKNNDENNITINCEIGEMPRVLICSSGDEIIIYLLPKFKLNEDEFGMRIETKRTIKIVEKLNKY